MNFRIFIALTLMFLASYTLGQNTSTEIRVVPAAEEFLPVMSPQWGGDIAITNREPLGRPSGAARSNGTAFIAVPDTGLIPNRGLVTYRSTNQGVTWSAAWSISPSLIISKTKMVRARNDSLYLFFLTGGHLYFWNVETTLLRNLTSAYFPPLRDFDVVASANGNIYAFIDIGGTDQIFTLTLSSSNNYGTTWAQQIFTQNGAHPRAYLNTVFGRRDTLFVSFYSPVNADIFRSPINLRRLRENNGLLELIDDKIVDNDTTWKRREHQCVRVGNVVWFFNQREPLFGEDSNIRCRVSTNLGITFASAFTIAGTSVDEYWFDAVHYSDGVDFIYFADSTGTSNDRLMYFYMEKTNPTVVQGRRRISNHPPVWSSRGYIPSLFQYPIVGGDVGAIWVGLDGTTRKVFYDSESASPLNVDTDPRTVPDGFVLMQNYPNPFNSSTKISWQSPVSSWQTLKIYDVLGNEVATLVDEYREAGRYEINFDASQLASGIYFYKLEAHPDQDDVKSFVQTKKFLLIK